MEAEKINKILESVYSQKNKKRIADDYERYQIFHGHLKDIIKDRIMQEFVVKETISEMLHRIVPINITQKIIKKLAMGGDPVRSPKDESMQDVEALAFYNQALSYDKAFRDFKNYFKLYKHSMLEPYINRNGIPSVRALASYQYSLYSDDIYEPTSPTEYIKHISFSGKETERDKDIHIIVNEEEIITVDGKGNIIEQRFNEYGVVPYTLMKESTNELIPLSDDDLVNMNIAICILLTDLQFATKYQAWSLIYTIGANTSKLTLNPNTIVSLERDQDGNEPKIDFIKPDLDSDAMLRQIEALVAMLLTSKNLSVGSVGTQVSTTNTASGISKLLDQAEVVEERNESIMYYKQADLEFWTKYAHNILPVWVQNGELNPEYVRLFSSNFELDVQFSLPEIKVSEKERTEIAKTKLEIGVITKKDAIMYANDVDEERAEKILNEINQERIDLVTEDDNGQNNDQTGSI